MSESNRTASIVSNSEIGMLYPNADRPLRPVHVDHLEGALAYFTARLAEVSRWHESAERKAEKFKQAYYAERKRRRSFAVDVQSIDTDDDEFGDEQSGQFRGSRQHRTSDSGCFSDHKRHTVRKEQPRAKSRVTVYDDEPEVDARTRRIDLAKDLLDFLYARNIEFDLRVANGQQVVNVRIPLDSHKSSPSVGACRGSREPAEGEARKGHSDESAHAQQPKFDVEYVNLELKSNSFVRELKRLLGENRDDGKGMP